MKKKIMTMAMMALAFTACTEEDLMQPTQGDAGTLHIANVTIDGQQVARTRVVADGGTPDGIPFNQSITGFTEGDVLTLHCRFDDNVSYTQEVHATFGADGTWQLTNRYTNAPITLAPDRENGKKWADVFMSADFFSGISLEGEAALNKAKELGAVQGKAIATENIHLLTDYLVATTSLTNQETQGFGSITIDTDLKSPTLGAVTIQLKHTYRVLLRLPKSAADVIPGTYIVDGTAHNVTSLGTLWAVVKNGNLTQYFPLTEVADNLQAIVQADTEGSYTLTGFKAVMLTEQSGASGEETTQNSLTLDLPFKVGTETTVNTGIALQSNHQYPLTLNIAPHTANVTLTSPLGKPGWGTDEEELSNLLNELLITVDGTQYIKLDGTATDVEKVKSIIETATAAGYTNFYVTGKKLTAYNNATIDNEAKTVVGEAIRQLAEETTVSLLVPDATSIGNEAFSKCSNLTSVSAPAATTIGDNAFFECADLTSLTFGEVITSVGTNAFDGVFAEGTTDWTTLCNLTLNSGQLSSTDENLKPSGNTWAGKTWASISYVDDEGNAVNIIDDSATDVATVKAQIKATLDAGISTIVVMGNLTHNYDATAARTIEGEAIRLLTTDEEGNPDSQSPYCGRINLMLPAATGIKASAFGGCTALTSVSAPAATLIHANAFGGCTALTNVEFPKVEKIFGNAFGGCTSLTYLTFGTKITEVVQYAFGMPEENWSTKCALTLNIGQKNSTGDLKPSENGWAKYTWASISYVNDDGNAVIDGTATKFATVKAQIETAINTRRSAIIVTGETLAEYSDDNSTDEANTVVGEAIRQLTLDSNGNPDANSSNMGTISLELPNVTSIGGKAFYNCDALTSLTFGSVITSMGTDAFNEVPTENCDLTLNSDQQNSTNYPVGTDGNGKPTWAGKTWASITLKVVTDK